VPAARIFFKSTGDLGQAEAGYCNDAQEDESSAAQDASFTAVVSFVALNTGHTAL